MVRVRCRSGQERLEQRLQGGEETQSFEVKAAMAWDVKTLVKDILTMANVRDGGSILIGVVDKTFARQGVSADQRATYVVDVMRDQLTKYADPHVDISVSFPVDRRGKQYVAIRVMPFREIPVISRFSSLECGLRAATIYYRNSNRRPESAPVSNSYDMRDIITVAAMRTRQRLLNLGAEPTATEPTLQAILGEELGGL